MGSDNKYIQEHYNNLNVLSFAKHKKANSLNSFKKKELNIALSAIAEQNIKKTEKTKRGKCCSDDLLLITNST